MDCNVTANPDLAGVGIFVSTAISITVTIVAKISGVVSTAESLTTLMFVSCVLAIGSIIATWNPHGGVYSAADNVGSIMAAVQAMWVVSTIHMLSKGGWQLIGPVAASITVMMSIAKGLNGRVTALDLLDGTCDMPAALNHNGAKLVNGYSALALVQAVISLTYTAAQIGVVRHYGSDVICDGVSWPTQLRRVHSLFQTAASMVTLILVMVVHFTHAVTITTEMTAGQSMTLAAGCFYFAQTAVKWVTAVIRQD